MVRLGRSRQNSQSFYRHGLLSALVGLTLLVTGCAFDPAESLAPTVSPSLEEPSSPIAAALTASPSLEAAPSPSTPLPSTTSGQLRPDWQTVTWQGLVIPIPPQAEWNANIKPGDQYWPILAAGAVTYPVATGVVELPFGPSFNIISFAGSLDDWLEQEQERSDTAVNVRTIQETTVAGLPARLYQPTVIGTCDIGVYIVALDQERLLRIWTDCLGGEPYDSVVKGLVIES